MVYGWSEDREAGMGCLIREQAHSEQMSIPLPCLHTQSSQQLLVLLARM